MLKRILTTWKTRPRPFKGPSRRLPMSLLVLYLLPSVNISNRQQAMHHSHEKLQQPKDYIKSLVRHRPTVELRYVYATIIIPSFSHELRGSASEIMGWRCLAVTFYSSLFPNRPVNSLLYHDRLLSYPESLVPVCLGPMFVDHHVCTERRIVQVSS